MGSKRSSSRRLRLSMKESRRQRTIITDTSSRTHHLDAVRRRHTWRLLLQHPNPAIRAARRSIKSLPALPTGEGWIWLPEFLGIFERIRVRERKICHPDQEKIGDKFTMPELDQVDTQNFIDRFSTKEKAPAKNTRRSPL